MSRPNEVAVQRRWDWPYPIIARAEGIYLWDTNGKRYIDGSGGSSVVTSVGHGVKEIPAAMAKQAEAYSFYPAHVFSNEKLLELADLLAELAPGELRHNCKVWMTVTGSDATDDAARLARQYWVVKGQPSKHIIIGRWQAFHGDNIFSVSISGHTGRRRMFTPMFRDMPKIPPAFCYRCYFEKTYPECNLLCARVLEDAICQAGPENVAAFIAEPVVGAALGVCPAPDGYFQIIRQICDRYDVLFIADEVMTALGRTGRWWGIEHWDTTPDIIALSKSLTSGHYPVAAVIARDELWETLRAANAHFRAGHTLNASAIGMTAAIETIRYIQKHNLVENACVVGEYFLQQLQSLLEYRTVGDVRGRGMMVGFEFVRDKATKEPFPPQREVAHLFNRLTFERGLVTYPCTGMVRGVAGDAILMAPPLITTKAQIDEMMAILHDSMQAFEMEVLRG
ncbi:MAG: aminotransferase class III-fold pyridoxal phosphate-dependent enzyme [Anaerolineae bacterium]|nr:aminotransferase class III-fold pyridoxal phosphate-dependent enzyme [Anaerolineae bacterium]